jgi:DNA-binding NtrC family response regulator
LSLSEPATAPTTQPPTSTYAPPTGQLHEPLREARRKASEAFERSYVRSVLERAEGNITRAAAIAEVSRQMVQKLMRKYGLPEQG